MAIRARNPGALLADLGAAVWRDRSIVLTWTMRGTRHLHPATDIRWLISVFGPVFGRPGRRAMELGIGRLVGDRAVAASATPGRGGHGHRRGHGQPPPGEGPPRRRGGRRPRPGPDPRATGIRAGAPAGRPGRSSPNLPGPHGEERYVAPTSGCRQRTSPAARMRWAALRPGSGRRSLRPAHGTSGPGTACRLLRPSADGRLGTAAPASAAREVFDRGPVRLTGAFDTLLLGCADRSLHAPRSTHVRSLRAVALSSRSSSWRVWSWRPGATSAAGPTPSRSLPSGSCPAGSFGESKTEVAPSASS